MIQPPPVHRVFNTIQIKDEALPAISNSQLESNRSDSISEKKKLIENKFYSQEHQIDDHLKALQRPPAPYEGPTYADASCQAHCPVNMVPMHLIKLEVPLPKAIKMTYGKANFGYGDEYKIDRVSKILITINRVTDD